MELFGSYWGGGGYCRDFFLPCFLVSDFDKRHRRHIAATALLVLLLCFGIAMLVINVAAHGIPPGFLQN